ncbi:MAG: ABC transporter substrate-binding protein [Spirochaetes bacterium]|nr:ABC transporter substrate-binding protein [Spirochaetota bacterium]
MKVRSAIRYMFILMMATMLTAIATPLFAGGQGEDDSAEALVGFFGPLSGDNAQYGQTFRNAIDLHVEQVNAEGGIDGRIVVVRAEDDRATPQEAANVAQNFAANRRMLAAVGSFSSSASMAAAPIFEENGMVQVSPTSSHPDFAGIGEHMFRIVTTQDVEGPLNAQFVEEQFSPGSVAVIYRQDDWGASASEFFIEEAEAMGMDIAFSQAVVPGTKDLRPLVTGLNSSDADVLYLALFYADAATLAQQMQQAGLEMPVVTNSSLFNPQLIELAGDAVEGFYVPSNFSPNSDRAAAADFVSAYREKTGNTPDQFAALAYDAIGVLTSGMQDAAESGELTRESIRIALSNLEEYEGATGVLQFDDEGNALRQSMTWLRIEDGDFRVVD